MTQHRIGVGGAAVGIQRQIAEGLQCDRRVDIGADRAFEPVHPDMADLGIGCLRGARIQLHVAGGAHGYGAPDLEPWRSRGQVVAKLGIAERTVGIGGSGQNQIVGINPRRAIARADIDAGELATIADENAARGAIVGTVIDKGGAIDLAEQGLGREVRRVKRHRVKGRRAGAAIPAGDQVDVATRRTAIRDRGKGQNVAMRQQGKAVAGAIADRIGDQDHPGFAVGAAGLDDDILGPEQGHDAARRQNRGTGQQCAAIGDFDIVRVDQQRAATSNDSAAKAEVATRHFGKATGTRRAFAKGQNLAAEIGLDRRGHDDRAASRARNVQPTRQIDRAAADGDRTAGASRIGGLDRLFDLDLSRIACGQKHPALDFGHAGRGNRALGIAGQRIDIAAIGPQFRRRRADRTGLSDRGIRPADPDREHAVGDGGIAHQNLAPRRQPDRAAGGRDAALVHHVARHQRHITAQRGNLAEVDHVSRAAPRKDIVAAIQEIFVADVERRGHEAATGIHCAGLADDDAVLVDQKHRTGRVQAAHDLRQIAAGHPVQRRAVTVLE